MARTEVNRLAEMQIFITVVESGSFSAAARICQLNPSTVSKSISRLESRLDARLINRSTRKLQLSSEGKAFYERSIKILEDITEAEHCAGAHEKVSGHLRVSVSIPVGRHFLLPLLPAFLSRYPDIILDLNLSDQLTNLLEERIDVAIRSGPMPDSSLITRKLAETSMVIVASPTYLAQHGKPEDIKDLVKHNKIGFNFRRTVETWPLCAEGERINITPEGNVRVSDGDTMYQLALAGVGLARLARFMVSEDIRAGRLVTLLEDYNPGDKEDIHAVFLGHGGYLPSRVRAFLDFLYEHVSAR